MSIPASPYVWNRRRALAVDSDAATCNHAIHEFFECTFRSRFLVAPLAARGQRVECESLNAAPIQGGVFVGAAGSGQG
jgi:hypothetical protein